MKLFTATFCGLAVAANAQFNLEVNANGARFGVLGLEVANIGGQNKDKQFGTGSWPVDIGNNIPVVPQINLPFPTPFSSPNTPSVRTNFEINSSISNKPLPSSA